MVSSDRLSYSGHFNWRERTMIMPRWTASLNCRIHLDQSAWTKFKSKFCGTFDWTRLGLRCILDDVINLYVPYKPYSFMTDQWARAVRLHHPANARQAKQWRAQRVVKYLYLGLMIAYQLILFVDYYAGGDGTDNLDPLVWVTVIRSNGFANIVHLEIALFTINVIVYHYNFGNQFGHNQSVHSVVRILDQGTDPMIFLSIANMNRVRCITKITFQAVNSFTFFAVFVFGFAYLTYLAKLLAVSIPLGHSPLWYDQALALSRFMSNILIQYFCCFLYTFIFMHMISLGTLYAPYVMAAYTIVQIRCRSCLHWIHGLRQVGVVERSEYFQTRVLLRARRVTVETLSFVLVTNRIYGFLLIVYLVCNVPLNSTIMMRIVSHRLAGDGDHSMQATIEGASFLAGLSQFVIFIFFHYSAAKFSELVHLPIKPLMSTRIGWRGQANPVAGLKLALHVQTFHIRKRYGITYACFGLVSFKTLFKFALIYGESLMYNYTDSTK